MYQTLNQNILEQYGWDVATVLIFVRAKPPEFFEDVE